MEDILIFGAFFFSMVCVVAYFAIPAFKKLKQSRQNQMNGPDDENADNHTPEDAADTKTDK